MHLERQGSAGAEDIHRASSLMAEQASHPASLHRIPPFESGPDLVLVCCQAVTCVQGDVRKPEHSAACVQQALERFQRLDILVNCAAGNFLVSLLPAWQSCLSNTESNSQSRSCRGFPGGSVSCLAGLPERPSK